MDTTTFNPATKDAPRTDAEYERAMDEMIDAMRRLHENMNRGQKEIERLRAATRDNIARIKAG